MGETGLGVNGQAASPSEARLILPFWHPPQRRRLVPSNQDLNHVNGDLASLWNFAEQHEQSIIAINRPPLMPRLANPRKRLLLPVEMLLSLLEHSAGNASMLAPVLAGAGVVCAEIARPDQRSGLGQSQAERDESAQL